MKLTDKAQATRQRILEAASQLFHQHGYNATGLEKVIKLAGVTKGNFYYYFKSKEELAIATLDWQFERMQKEIQEQVFSQPLSPLNQLLGMADYVINSQYDQQKNGQVCGCYFGNFALELSTMSELINDKVKSIFSELLATFTRLLKAAKKQSEISENIDPTFASNIILSQLEGAILINKTRQNAEILDNSMTFIRNYLNTDCKPEVQQVSL